MMRPLSLLLLVPILLASDAPAHAREIARYENFRFRMPDGWRHKDLVEGGRNRVIVPPQYPPDEWLNMRLYPSEIFRGSLQQFVEAKAESIRKANGNTEVQPVTLLRQSGAGGVVYGKTMALVRTDAPDGTSRVTWFLVYGFQLPDRFEHAYVVFNSWQTYQQHAKTIDELIDGLRFASGEVLVPGEPPLSQQIADDQADVVEWLVDVPLTPAQRAWVRDQLVAEWQRNDRSEMEKTLGIARMRAQLADLPPDKRDYAREQMLPEAVAQWRAKPNDPQARALLAIYESARQPIASGDPPLTRRVTDATLDALYFMASQVEGRTVEPTPAQKDAFAKAVAAQYAALPDEQKRAMAQAPLLWAGLRAAWPEAPEAQRQEMKARFAQMEPVKQVIASLPQQKGLSDADFLAEMQKLNRQHESYMFMSNLSQSMHNANMMMIYNMGGTGWTYRR
jgi:hypothetical protein